MAESSTWFYFTRFSWTLQYFRKPYIHSSLFIIGLYTEVLHYFGGTADRCPVSIYPYRWQAQGVRGSGLALTAMYTPLSH